MRRLTQLKEECSKLAWRDGYKIFIILIAISVSMILFSSDVCICHTHDESTCHGMDCGCKDQTDSRPSHIPCKCISCNTVLGCLQPSFQAITPHNNRAEQLQPVFESLNSFGVYPFVDPSLFHPSSMVLIEPFLALKNSVILRI